LKQHLDWGRGGGRATPLVAIQQ